MNTDRNDVGEQPPDPQGLSGHGGGDIGSRDCVPQPAIGLALAQRDDARPDDARRSPLPANGPYPGDVDLAALQPLPRQPHGEPRAEPVGPERDMTIARQVADIAQGLAALADRLVGTNRMAMAEAGDAGAGPDGSVAGTAAGNVAGDVAEADCIAFLEGQFRIRRLRSRHLPQLSLGEPAWDILLDLAVAHYWRRETSVTSLCIAADVPSTTALRWINSMTREGLIVRRPCLRDGRRSFLAISPDSYQAMLAMAADGLRTELRMRDRYQRHAA